MGPGTAGPPSTNFPSANPSPNPSVNPQGPPPGKTQISRPSNTFNPSTAPNPTNPASPKPTTPNPGPGALSGPTLGAGAALGAAATVGAAAAAGITLPAWAIPAGMIAGAALMAAAANQIWPSVPGDGTEGSPQELVIPDPGQAGEVGQAGALYEVFVSFTYANVSLKYGNYSWYTVNNASMGTKTGPLSLTREVYNQASWGGNTYDNWMLYLNHQGGKTGVPGLVGQSNSYRIFSNWSLAVSRVDGTPPEEDIAQGGKPNIPPIAATNVTQNTGTGGDGGPQTPAPQLGSPNTPTLPNPAPSPTPTTATPSAPSTVPGGSAPTATPSAGLPPVVPATATPSAPSTNAGTPTPQAPTTGPATGGSTPQTGGGGSPNPLLAAAITAPAIAALTNLVGDKPPTPTAPTPTETPATFPSDTKNSDTAPNPTPTSQTGSTVNPNPAPQPNPVTPSANSVDSQMQGQQTQTEQDIQTWIKEMEKLISDTPTTNTTINQTTINQTVNNIENTVNNITNIQETVNETNSQTNELIQLAQQADVDIASLLAIIGTLGTAAFISQQTTTITAAISNQPSPCAYPGYHPQNQAERAAISGKVDGVNTVLGTVTNVQIAEAKTGIANVAGLIGTPVAQGAQTVLGGIDATTTFLGKFAKSLYLDKIYNGLTLLVSLHNAAMLSRNLAETVGYFIDSGMDALGIKDENEEPLDLGTTLGNTISNTIKNIVGEDVYNGVSDGWKKLSAIYTAAINILDNITAMLAGLAESMEIIGNYTGKIGNALKRGGVVLENAYNWMDDNLRLKTGRFATIQKIADGINTAEDVVNNLTEVTDVINESEDLVNEIKGEWTKIKGNVTEGEGEKATQETASELASQGAGIDKPDLITPED